MIIIPCSARKLEQTAPARELYASPHFQYTLRLAEQIDPDVWILSALHGLVRPDEILEPYDITFHHSACVRTVTIAEQLADIVGDTPTEIVALLPALYSEMLRHAVRHVNRWREREHVSVVDVYEGSRGIGEQRGRLARLAREVAA